ncbi:hypothetical protein NCC78_24530 [Micromonospora phytophila]|uniref:hypothetical protein n=1 Tax=Micromonospora phytophila TaxID=709888 RepID=UPI00202FD14C|nr:hypothetical protein [Micromonospora phytophila]MCM0677819.1 hypothetical protein [Micromonospora phytophila]
MPTRLAALELAVRPDYGMFVVHDVEADTYDAPIPAKVGWCGSGQGVFSVGSVISHTFAVSAVFECWDAMPPEPGGWSEIDRIGVELPTGRLEVWQLTGGPVMTGSRTRAEFRLPRPGRWAVRACADGRGEAATAWHKLFTDHQVGTAGFDTAVNAMHGVERYLFQFFPPTDR